MIKCDRVVGEIEYFECLESMAIVEDDVEDGLAKHIIGHVDVGDALQELNHLFKTTSSETVAA